MRKMKKVADRVARVVVPRSIAGGLVRVAITAVIVAGVGGGLVWKSSVDHAKKNSSTTLARAEKTAAAARQAYVSGAADDPHFTKAMTSLSEAKASFNKGSYFNRSSYKRAESYAKESIQAAKTIIAWRKSLDLAKSDSSSSVDSAKALLEEARPAATPGLRWEKTQVAHASAALSLAEASFNEGSYANEDGYIQAKSYAEGSAALSQAVTTRVNARLAAAGKRQGFKPYFDFYKRYPKTSQAAQALNNTLTRLNNRLDDLSGAGNPALANLTMIASFESQYPKPNIPASVKKLARQQLLFEAQRELTNMWPSVSWCRTFVSDMLGRSGETQTSCGSANYRGKGVTQQLTKIVSLLPALRQPPAMRSLYSDLRDGSAELGSMDAIMKVHGTNAAGHWTYTSSQVYSIRSYTDSLSSNLKSVKSLLAALNKS
jgi:hypothetical protein